MKLITKKGLLIIWGFVFAQSVFSQAPNISYNAASLTSGTPFTISPANIGGAVPATVYGQVTTFAGSTTQSSGYVNGTGTAARFNNPQRIVGDASGNLYVADYGNNAIRKITSAGVVTTFAGSATGASGFTDGSGTAASFNGPDGLAVDASGNLFVSDYANNAIRKITPAGVVSTFYTLTGTFGPAGLCFDGSGNLIVVAKGLSRIMKITTAGVASTIAGNYYGYANGTGTAALFENPTDVQIDASGNIYVADYLNNAIRKITPAGVVTTYAGSDVSGNTGGYVNATGTAARFNNPTGIALAAGGIIYVEDFVNNDIRKIMPDGSVTLVAGSSTHVSGATDGTGTSVLFHSPIDLYIDGTGTGYSVDVWASVRKIMLTGYAITGTLPAGLSFDSTSGTISGTPTGTITTQTDTITAYNANGYSTATVTFSPAVVIPAPNISYATSANILTTGTSFSISPTNTGGAVPATTYGQVSTFAGSTSQSSGYVNGTGTAVLFNNPQRIVGDASGNLYVADYGNNAIRKITSAGVVTTFAGSATGASGFTDGSGTAASFNGPDGLAVDASGNLFVSDYANNAIRKITPSGVVSTFYTLTGTFGSAGLCFDGSGNLIVAAKGLSRILKITPAAVMTVIAGNYYGYANGTGTAALFENPTDVQIDASGNIYVADYLNNAIRKITPAGVVTTYAGSDVSGNTGGYVNATGTAARFNNPTGIALAAGGIIYVEDFVNNDIRKIMPDGSVTLVAGSPTHAAGATDGTGTSVLFHSPIDLYIDATGTGYSLDVWASIRKVVLTGYSIRGTLPAGLTFDSTTGTISGTPTGTVTAQTDTITAYNASGYSSTVVTFSPPALPPTISYNGSQTYAYNVGTPISTLTPTVTGNPVPYTGYTTTFAGNGVQNSIDGTGTSASFGSPDGIAVDSKGNMYVTDVTPTNEIRKISPTAVVTTLAGSATKGFTNGTGAAASFSHPVGLATDTAGNVYVADGGNNAIRKITPSGVVTTFVGGTLGSADGTGTAAQFNDPTGVALDASGNIYVADYLNNSIRKVTPAGVVTTFAGGTQGSADGTGTAAQFNLPSRVAIDASGNLYVTDKGNQRIRKITPAGVVTTIAGTGTAGFADGPAASAMFNGPEGLTVDNLGNIYVADYKNFRIRQISPAGMVTTLAGSSAYGHNDGVGSVATFGSAFGGTPAIAVDASGTIAVGEYQNNRIRKTVTTPYTISPALPAGLNFDPSTGIISGTPTAASTAATYTITAYNMVGMGSTPVTISINSPIPSNPANDFDKNWVYVRSYDENGTEIGSSKSFFDNNGKPTQSQTKNETVGQVLASQTIYDLQGRGVVNTLAAPINNSAFAYNNNFVTNGGNNYSYLNFDGDPTSTSAPYAKLNNPDAVDNNQIGSLGWYYSNNNTFEPYVAATSYPYGRSDFYHDGTGAAKRSAGIGEQLKMGTGHETTNNGFSVQNELNNYLAIRNQFFASAVGGSPTSMAGQALQTVSTDQNGLSAVSITDLTGKMSLMTGRADPSGWLAVSNTLTANAGRQDFEVTIANSASSILSINSNQIVNIYYNGGSSPVYTGAGNNYLYPGPAGTYVITSFFPFRYTLTDGSSTNNITDAAALFNESVAAIQYFRLVSPSSVTIAGGAYTLWDMTAEQDITSSYQSNNTLPAGYYRVIATAPAANGSAGTNTVTITYTNKYSDISYNYYNQLGQLIASIAPNGVQQLIQNGYSSYATASQLPFVTLYAYDLQGRLTSTTTPDGGTSNFVYRQDGKIRFSQNAYQANAANAGTGNVEKFSYTNYDNIGRPVESGEYTVTSATFASLAANTTLLEATDASANITGGTKLSQINTYYDVPATNLTLNGYTQDPGFLKGVVSYTSNANSTTWYNFDDHGRVTWTVKQISGLTGYKTVDYTYNDQGNVTKVDYQKGTSAERFIHYYTYDADGRLINVQTSRDDIAKVQQAAYTYYLHGPLKRTELGGQLQGIDYIYTPQGWLKSINSPKGDATYDPGQDGLANAFAKDAFGMQLEYFFGDYKGLGSGIGNSITTGQQDYYNGLVSGISWQSNKPTSVVSSLGTSIQNPAMYTYSYDSKYQLAGATWGTPFFEGKFNGFTPSSNNIFQEKNITYDFNGNITSLQRTNNAGALSDDFNNGYAYQNNANKLTSVTNATTSTSYATYDYDELGRMKRETLTGAPNPYYLKYDVTDKIIGIYSDQAMTILQESYTYDESGNRIKTVNPNGTTYYVYDSNGSVMAIYTGTTPTMSEVPFYGSSRLGTYTVSSGNYVYELRDNVGSVRVVINRNKNSSGQADITTFNDYFPYGSIAQSGGTTYRYDYQGAYAEKDPVTGWNNFQLRMYDGRVGRWLSVDPQNIGFTPYNGMTNNPTSTTDPNGGCPDDDPNCDCVVPQPATSWPSGTPTSDSKVDFNGTIWKYDKDSKFPGWTIDLHSVPVYSGGSSSSSKAEISNGEQASPFGVPLIFFTASAAILEKSKFINVASAGTKLGVVTSFIGIGNDSRLALNGKISLSTWSYNTAFNLIGTKASPVGLAYGVGTYLYPGGVQGALADWHHIIYPGWWDYPTHRDFEEKK
jgi:RHS repeat-associated protein